MVLDYLLEQLTGDDRPPEVRKALWELRVADSWPAPGQPGGGMVPDDFDDDGKLRVATPAEK